MNIRRPIRVALPGALLLSLLLAACSGGENPEAMLASAKDYLARNDPKAAVIQIKNALQKNPDLGEARYLLGKALVEGGDPAAGELELRKAVALKYQPDQTQPLIAQAMLQQGKFKKLVEEFGKVQLASAEQNADLQTSVGIAHASSGNLGEADKAFATALAAKGDHAPALLAQARIKSSHGDLAGAMGIVDTVIAKSPANAEAWKLKGDLSQGLQQSESAVTAYRKALEVKRDYVGAHAALIALLMRLDKVDDAGKQVEALKKEAPKHLITSYVEAQYAFQKKDVARARELVQQLLKIAPEYPAGLQLAGAIEYQANSYVQAEHFLSRLVRLAPESHEARRLLALTHLRLGQPARAMAVLEPILGKIDQDSNMLALVGEVSMQNGDVTKAEQYFSKAARLDPKSLPKRTAVALSQLAKGNDGAFAELEAIAAVDTGTRADMALIASSVRLGHWDKALKAIESLEKKQPGKPLASHLRGGVQVTKKDLAAARKSFEHALTIDATFFPSAAALASLDLADKKPEDARKRFDTVLAADPKNIQAILALAELKARTGGTPDEVAALISRAVTVNPSEPGPRQALIEFYALNKDVKKGVAAAQEAVAAMPDRPELLNLLGQLQLAAGESNQALATFGKLSGLQPNSPVPHLRIAEVHLAAKNRDAALQSLRKALEIKPDMVEAQRGLIGMHLEAGASEQAVSLAREIQKQRPKEGVGYSLEGDSRAAKKAWSEAAVAYRSGIKAAPSSELAIKLHTALRAANNDSEAEKFASTWLKENPKDAVFRLHLGDRSMAKQDLDGAAQFYRMALEAQPNNPIALNNLAWVFGRQKNPKALEYAEKANALAPNNPAFMDTMAMILLDKGDTKRAVDLLKSALDRSPQASGLRLNLAKALVKSGDKAGARKELEALAKLGDKFPAQAEVAGLMKGL